MVTALRGLAEPAPLTLASRVMAAVGIGDQYAQIPGPIGPLLVAWGREGITAVERAGDETGFELEYSLQFGRPLHRVDAMPDGLRRQVDRRLEGERAAGPPVDLSHLTSFEREVLQKTMEIPRGEVRPYAWVAREIGRPRAVRAVGSALANNPIPFVIPCHRVVRTDGRIGEYGAGGPQAKREVLASEGVNADELERLASAGIRYFGSDTTRIFCYPSCRHARRTTPQHLVSFRSGEDAMSSGYRACKVCRPLLASPFAA
ncbi:MAG: methylated-DNA-[protein]-cysteine S-methyltransferase [Chloroflexota bacterium]|nr:methylated-DNA-[protein]-cysteine S-methyltransferase [Chloroflexota bacterium]